MAYRSIYTQVYYGARLTANNPLCPSLAIPSASLATATLHPAPLYVDPALPSTSFPYSSQLYSIPSISPSALSHVPATLLLQPLYKCRHLRMAIKSKKRELSPVPSFLYPRTHTVGLVILRMGSLRLASLPEPITT